MQASEEERKREESKHHRRQTNGIGSLLRSLFLSQAFIRHVSLFAASESPFDLYRARIDGQENNAGFRAKKRQKSKKEGSASEAKYVAFFVKASRLDGGVERRALSPASHHPHSSMNKKETLFLSFFFELKLSPPYQQQRLTLVSRRIV